MHVSRWPLCVTLGPGCSRLRCNVREQIQNSTGGRHEGPTLFSSICVASNMKLATKSMWIRYLRVSPFIVLVRKHVAHEKEAARHRAWSPRLCCVQSTNQSYPGGYGRVADTFLCVRSMISQLHHAQNSKNGTEDNEEAVQFALARLRQDLMVWRFFSRLGCLLLFWWRVLLSGQGQCNQEIAGYHCWPWVPAHCQVERLESRSDVTIHTSGKHVMHEHFCPRS